MNFEGKTGPYLLYALVRIFALLEKSSEETIDFEYHSISLNLVERTLMLKILQTEEVIERSYQTLSPHFLCDFAFDIAQVFSRFYSAHPILSEKDDMRRCLRLWLCKNTRNTLVIIRLVRY